MEKNFATVIMAAGKGTRMKNSENAKVMFEVAGKPMIQRRSPGNFTVIEDRGEVYLCLYGELGSETRLRLPPAPTAGP